MRISTFLPHVGVFGGVRRFLELGNAWCAAGHEVTYHPGETNLLRADVVVVNKVDSAERDNVERVLRHIEAVNPLATVVTARSPVTLEPGPSLEGKRVLVVEDGPTLTHGGMAFGAGTVAALTEGAARAGLGATTACRLHARVRQPGGWLGKP